MRTILKPIAATLTVITMVFGLAWIIEQTMQVVTPAATPIPTAAEPSNYHEVEMNVSGYCAGECCCDQFADGITASGIPAKGKIIAAPKKYAFGTRMNVPGYGMAVVEDRGGAIKGNKIDLLFPSHQEALNFGRQELIVKVFKRIEKE